MPLRWGLHSKKAKHAIDILHLSTVHAEIKSYGIEGRYIALVVGRFGEFSNDSVKLRDYVARKRAYANTGISTHRSTWRCRCSR